MRLPQVIAVATAGLAREHEKCQNEPNPYLVGPPSAPREAPQMPPKATPARAQPTIPRMEATDDADDG